MLARFVSNVTRRESYQPGIRKGVNVRVQCEKKVNCDKAELCTGE